jgi:hypothetical protein
VENSERKFDVQAIQELTMQITLTLPDDLARQLLRQTDPNRFAQEAIQSALQEQTDRSAGIGKPISKWAMMARRVRDNPLTLGEYRERARMDGEDFRKSLTFEPEQP